MDQSDTWKTLVHKNIKSMKFPIHPNTNYHSTFVTTINQLYQQYYHPEKIKLQDQAQFHDCIEYMKRNYDVIEWNPKIKVLSDYYKYHKEMPRFYTNKIANIMNYYQQQKRDLQYEGVTRKMNTQKNTNPSTQRQFNPITKMIHNVQLSYVDFEKKQKKKKNYQKSTKVKQNQNYGSLNKKNNIYTKKIQCKTTPFQILYQNGKRNIGNNVYKKIQYKNGQQKPKKIMQQLVKKKKYQIKSSKNKNKIEHTSGQSVTNSIGAKSMSRSKSKCDLLLSQGKLMHFTSRIPISNNIKKVRKTVSSKNILEGIEKKHKGIKTMFSKILLVKNR